jgi:predicted Zn finger-like uncharacterized protein
MIITCNNCNKNFEVDSSLIPEKGRLVQCISCDHKWFFKKVIKERSVPIVKTKAIIEEPRAFEEDVTRIDEETTKTIELLDDTINDAPAIEKISIQNNNEIEKVKEDVKEPNIKKSINKKSYNILGLTFVFIISFIALIIVIDTFQKPISTFVPNIEFILYNLYETINDIILFFNDLI